MTASGTVEVALCFDANMALPAAMTIASAMANSRHPIRFHLIIDPSPKLVEFLQRLLKYLGSDGRIFEASPERSCNFDEYRPYALASTATYRRLLLPELLPDLGRVIYLDADVLIRHDLEELWTADLNDHVVGAVADAWAAENTVLAARHPHGYFNAGVLLLDCRRWRDENISYTAISAIRAAQENNSGFVELYEQGPLNDVLQNRWQTLSARWNFTGYFSDAAATSLNIPESEMQGIRDDPAIVHFVGGYKPWLKDFAQISRYHREYTSAIGHFQQELDVGGFVWPGSFAILPEHHRRRFLAMSLVRHAQSTGVRKWVVLAKGTLALDVLAVACEQELEIACITMENPLFHRGRFGGHEVLSVPEALRCGYDAFIIADFRSSQRTRAYLACAAAAAGRKLTAAGVSGPMSRYAVRIS